MKRTVSFSMFCDKFRAMDREDNFSYYGLRALFNYLEELKDSCGIDIELDVIALCCDFTEYDNLDEFRSEYGDGDDYPTIDKIRDQTIVIDIPDGDGFIIQVF